MFGLATVIERQTANFRLFTKYINRPTFISVLIRSQVTTCTTTRQVNKVQIHRTVFQNYEEKIKKDNERSKDKV